LLSIFKDLDKIIKLVEFEAVLVGDDRQLLMLGRQRFG
jgi:hypothetical protein